MDARCSQGGASSLGGSGWARSDASSEAEAEDLTVCSTNIRTYAKSSSESDHESKKTMQDRLVSAAASGSLELLKFAGGITLSTTGKLVAPPLMVTHKLLLPALWEGIKELSKSYTPQRVKDWFQIVSSSLYHVLDVLRNTHHGVVFRSRAMVVGADIADCITSDTSRQLITDSMATLIKLGEALHTPEFKSLLSQLNVLGARMVDAAASGRNKQLFHDIEEAAWSLIQLSSDPSTIVALAEVTATLCHTLEMEDSLHRRKSSPQRRYQRNQFTRQIYNDRNLTNDPNVTVEQVIMSSLNGNLTNINDLSETATETGFPLGERSKESGGPVKNSRTDSDYLEQKIHNRINSIDQQRMRKTTIFTKSCSKFHDKEGNTKPQPTDEETRNEIEELVVETVSDGEGEDTINISKRECIKSSNIAKQPLEYENQGIEEHTSSHNKTKPALTLPAVPNSIEASPTEKISSLSQFYHKLDEIMMEKRSVSLNEYLKRQKHSEVLADRGSVRTRFSGPPTIKSTLNDLRRESREGDHGIMERFSGKGKKILAENSLLSTILFLSVISIVMFWFSFGCYGMFMFWTNMTPSAVTKLPPHTYGKSDMTQEVIIRVVREVRHLDQNGKLFHPAEVSSEDVGDIDKKKIVSCVTEISDNREYILIIK